MEKSSKKYLLVIATVVLALSLWTLVAFAPVLGVWNEQSTPTASAESWSVGSWSSLYLNLNTYASSGGEYVITLTRDFTATGTSATILANTNVKINFNGHTILNGGTNSGSLFTVKNGATLTFISNGTGGIGKESIQDRAVYVEDGGTFVLDNTKIGTLGWGYSSTINGGAIYVASGGTCICDNGQFDNCRAVDGGAIYVENGGTLAFRNNLWFNNCIASRYGGAIYTKSSLVLNSIVAKNCNAQSGGALFLSGTGNEAIISSGTFEGDSVNGTDYANGYEVRTGSGGAIFANKIKSLKVSNCSFTNCKATVTMKVTEAYYEQGCGGAIFGNSVAVDISSCSFNACTLKVSSATGTVYGHYSYGNGGAVCLKGATGKIDDCTFTECSSTGGENGGGIYLDTSNIGIGSCDFEGCRSDKGGGLYLWQSTATVSDNTIFSECEASRNGGAISLGSGSTLNMSGGEIKKNVSNSEGGGIADDPYYSGNNITLNAVTVSENKGSSGGGIYTHVYYSNLSCINCIIESNEASGSGGGVYAVTAGADSFIMNGTVIRNNKADDGGGIYSNSYSTFQLTNVTIQGNTANWNGGGIYGLCNVSSCEISGNKAKNGSAVYENGFDVSFSIIDTKISNNVVAKGGLGAVYVPQSKSVTLGGTTSIYQNTNEDGNTDNVYLENGSFATISDEHAPAEGFKVKFHYATDSTPHVLFSNLTDDLLPLVECERDVPGMAYEDGQYFLMSPLGFTVLQDNATLSITKIGWQDFDFSYSFDMLNWSPVTWETDTFTINYPAEKRTVYLASESESGLSNGVDKYINITSDVQYKVEGYLITLLKKGVSYEPLPDYAFCQLFQNSTTLTDISQLVFPSNTSGKGTYKYMFKGCTGLTEVSTLSQATMAEDCCLGMFQDCTALTTAPALPATKLAKNCYCDMFKGCTKLTTVPKFSATTLAENCCQYMFADCTALTTVPTLPATELADYCYQYMFSGCSALVNAPELSANKLAPYCYQYMFQGCTKLTTVPKFSATTVAENCCQYMFAGCTALTTVPALSATELADNCYQYMFSGCTALVNAPELSANKFAPYCCQYMFSDCTALVNASKFSANKLASYCCQYMFSGCTALVNASEFSANELAPYCCQYMFDGCTSLTNVSDLFATTVSESSYAYMFKNCTSLSVTPVIYATVVNESGMQGMFLGCTNLQSACELLSTSIAKYAYKEMFYGCEKLVATPKIDAKEIGTQALVKMFQGCSSLKLINVNFEKWDGFNNTSLDWVEGVAPQGLFICPSNLPEAFGTDRIPQGWTKCETFFTVNVHIGDTSDTIISYRTGKPHGSDIAELELSDPSYIPQDNKKFAGWKDSNGNFIDSAKILVTADSDIYATYMLVPQFADSNGLTVDESETTWFVTCGYIYVVASNLTISGASEMSLVFEQDCSSATLDNSTVTSQRGIGLRVKADKFDLTLIGDNTVEPINYLTENANAVTYGIFANGDLFVCGNGNLTVTTFNVDVELATGKALNYGIYCNKTLLFDGKQNISVTTGKENTTNFNSQSVAICADILNVSNAELTVRSGFAKAVDALSCGIKANTFAVIYGTVNAYAGGAEGMNSKSCAICSAIDSTEYIKMSVNNCTEEVTEETQNFVQQDNTQPLVVYCPPKIFVSKSTDETTGADVLNPEYGTASENLRLYDVNAYNFGEMQLKLQWYNGTEWVDGNADGITAVLEKLSDTNYTVVISTTETTATGVYTYRATNGLTENALSEEFTVTIEKKRRDMPEDIQFKYKTYNELAIVAVDGYEYTIDDEHWITDTDGEIVFTDLIGGQEYTVKVRAPESVEYAQSKVNDNFRIVLYTSLEYAKLTAISELQECIKDNLTDELQTLADRHIANIQSCTDETDVTTAKDNALAEIILYMQKEECKSRLVAAAGENVSTAMQPVIAFAQTLIDNVKRIDDLAQAFTQAELAILRQKTKEQLDEYVLPIDTQTSEFKASVNEAKSMIDNTKNKDELSVAYEFACKKIRLRAEKDDKKSQIDQMVSATDVSTSLTALIDEVKGDLDSATTTDELNSVYAESVTKIELRMQKDSDKKELDELVGSNASKDLEQYLAQCKNSIESATDMDRLNALFNTAKDEIAKLKYEEELTAAKTSAQNEIYELTDNKESKELASAINNAIANIKAATTLEEVETARQNGIAEITKVLEAGDALSPGAVATIAAGGAGVSGAAIFIVIKKIRLRKFGR